MRRTKGRSSFGLEAQVSIMSGTLDVHTWSIQIPALEYIREISLRRWPKTPSVVHVRDCEKVKDVRVVCKDCRRSIHLAPILAEEVGLSRLVTSGENNKISGIR